MAAANSLNISQTGFVSFDGTSTFNGRTLQSGTGISISNANGVNGDPVITNTASSSGTVTSVSGTIDQVAVATGTTTPVISLVGPYTPATYTAHGVLVGESNSSIVALATGSAGQVLQSGGASADPAYSTATYPTTAGTSGNVLTSDGTNWLSSAATGGGIAISTGTMTSAQIKAAHGTPFQVIAAPGAGKVINVVGSTLKYVYGGSNVFVAGAAQSLSLYYGTSEVINSGSSNETSISNALLIGTVNGAVASQTSQTFTAAQENLGVFIYNPVATEISGNAGNNNTVIYSLVYFIV